jgi:transposase-like protein
LQAVARYCSGACKAKCCWFHKVANVLGALPKSAYPGAKKALADIWNAEDKDHARAAVKAFAPEVHPCPAMTPGRRGRLHGQRHEATKLEDPCGRCSRS